MDVHTLLTHIYVQTTCKVNFASNDPFKHVLFCVLLNFDADLKMHRYFEQANIQNKVVSK